MKKIHSRIKLIIEKKKNQINQVEVIKDNNQVMPIASVNTSVMTLDKGII